MYIWLLGIRNHFALNNESQIEKYNCSSFPILNWTALTHLLHLIKKRRPISSESHSSSITFFINYLRFILELLLYTNY